MLRPESLRPESLRPESLRSKSGRPFGVIRNERFVEGPSSRVDRLGVEGRCEGEGRSARVLRDGLPLRCEGEMLRDGGELFRDGGETLREGGELFLDGGELLRDGGELLRRDGELPRCEGETEREGEELPRWIFREGDPDGLPCERAELPERESPRRCASVSLPIHTTVEASAIIAMPLM